MQSETEAFRVIGEKVLGIVEKVQGSLPPTTDEDTVIDILKTATRQEIRKLFDTGSLDYPPEAFSVLVRRRSDESVEDGLSYEVEIRWTIEKHEMGLEGLANHLAMLIDSMVDTEVPETVEDNYGGAVGGILVVPKHILQEKIMMLMQTHMRAVVRGSTE